MTLLLQLFLSACWVGLGWSLVDAAGCGFAVLEQVQAPHMVSCGAALAGVCRPAPTNRSCKLVQKAAPQIWERWLHSGNRCAGCSWYYWLRPWQTAAGSNDLTFDVLQSTTRAKSLGHCSATELACPALPLLMQSTQLTHTLHHLSMQCLGQSYQLEANVCTASSDALGMPQHASLTALQFSCPSVISLEACWPVRTLRSTRCKFAVHSNSIR